MSKINLENFQRRIRALYNIDYDFIKDVLPEADWPSFRDDPVRYLISTDHDTQIALWIQIQKRSEKWDV